MELRRSRGNVSGQNQIQIISFMRFSDSDKRQRAVFSIHRRPFAKMVSPTVFAGNMVAPDQC